MSASLEESIKQEWWAPKHVETPNILEDIKKYCGLSFTQEEIDSLPQGVQRKLRVLAERLEFIAHLMVLREFVERNQRSNVDIATVVLDRQEFTQITKTYTFVLNGHDLAGVNFDIEALVFYLLLTVVDTVKGKENYIDPFEWLSQSNYLERFAGLDEANLRAQLNVLRQEYLDNFSLTRGFVDAFVNDLPQATQQQFIKCVAVVKVANSGVKPESLKTWRSKTDEEKIKKIAKHLYHIRSEFTHASMRTFFPAVSLSFNPALSGSNLLCRRECDLLGLMRQAVQEIIKRNMEFR